MAKAKSGRNFLPEGEKKEVIRIFIKGKRVKELGGIKACKEKAEKHLNGKT